MKKFLTTALFLIVLCAFAACSQGSATSSGGSGDSSTAASSDSLSASSESAEVSSMESAATSEERAKMLFAEKAKEYVDRYGAPDIVEVENQNRDTYAKLTGLCVAQLIDFARDGQSELLVVYYNPEPDSSTRGSLGYVPTDYICEVWEYSDDDIACVYEGDVNAANGGVMFRDLYSGPNGDVLIDDYGAVLYYNVYTVYGYDNGTFKVLDHFGAEEGSDGKSFFIGDKTGVTYDEYSAFLDEYMNQFDESAKQEWFVTHLGRSFDEAAARLEGTLDDTRSTLAVLGV